MKLYLKILLLFWGIQSVAINAITQKDALCQKVLKEAETLAKAANFDTTSNRIVNDDTAAIDNIISLIEATKTNDDVQENLKELLNSLFEILFTTNIRVKNITEKTAPIIKELYLYKTTSTAPFQEIVIKTLLIATQINISRFAGYEGQVFNNSEIKNLISKLKKEAIDIYKKEKEGIPTDSKITKQNIKNFYSNLKKASIAKETLSNKDKAQTILICTKALCTAGITIAVGKLLIGNKGSISQLINTISNAIQDTSSDIAGIMQQCQRRVARPLGGNTQSRTVAIFLSSLFGSLIPIPYIGPIFTAASLSLSNSMLSDEEATPRRREMGENEEIQNNNIFSRLWNRVFPADSFMPEGQNEDENNDFIAMPGGLPANIR